MFSNHHTMRVIVDSGATGNMIQHTTTKQLGVKILKTSQSAQQADWLFPAQRGFTLERDDTRKWRSVMLYTSTGILQKNNGREQYLVSSKQNGLVHIRKFAGSQLRANMYKIWEEKCFRVPSGRKDIARTEPNDIDKDNDLLLPHTKPVIPDTFGILANDTIMPRDQ